MTTLAEAARSLGAGWATVIVRVIVPNIKTALLSASFISIALVLGEFTFASLLNYDTLQVAINLQGKANAQESVAASLASILFAAAAAGRPVVRQRRRGAGRRGVGSRDRRSPARPRRPPTDRMTP